MKKQAADPMSEAALRGDAESIRTLLAQAATRKNRKSLDTALGHAVKGGHAQCVALLLKAGADPDSKAVSDSLLIEAAERGDLEVVKLLVKAGADIQRRTAGTDAFAAALEMDRVKVADFLKSQGADWATPTLRHACEHGDLKRARQALNAGADVESKGGIFSESPLMTAAGNGHAQLVQLLLKRGANPNTRVEGKTALYDAVQHGNNLETVNALVEAGGNIHADWYGETVLMAAAGGGNLPIVKRLIELGADVAARDKDRGMSVLDHAKSGKNKELIAYLNSLGAVADRDKPRALARALAKKFGGKPVEHVAGFMLNARFQGTDGQFNIGSDGFSLHVHGLDFGESEFKRSKDAQMIFASAKPASQRQKFEPVKLSSAGFLVFRTLGAIPLSVAFVKSFCARHGGRFNQVKLAKQEIVRLGANFASFRCPLVDFHLADQRLDAFARLIQGISRPPQPERRLFTREWLLKTSPASGATTRHQLGGKVERPVRCPHCGGATHLMAQLDLSDLGLPKTALGRGKLPVFWCLDCLEWDAAFFDVSGSVPKPINLASKKTKTGKIEAGEESLPERPMALVPVAAGKKAGRKCKLGGSPTWIQMDEMPDCPKCEKPMAFVLQLASDSRISYGDMGMLYAFACPECRVTASLIQSH